MTARRLFLSLTVCSSFVLASVCFGQSDSAKKMVASDFANTHADPIKVLNSASDEATPFISADNNTIYFSSYRSKGQQPSIYRATRSASGEWGEPQLYSELPGKEGLSSLTISADGRTAIIQSCNRADGIYSTCDIYTCDIEGSEIKNIRPLNNQVNSEWWEGQPYLSADGQLLFFASDRKGGHGSSDIYMCSRNASGDWGAPVDLNFNTGANELSPLIAADNQTLYFASDMSGGQGGFDIYVTYRKGDNEWTQPKNLGPAVNTPSNELFFYIPPKENAVYVSSDRPGGQGGFDLYRIVPNVVPPKPKFIAFSGRTLDAMTNQPVKAEPTVSLQVSSTGEGLNNAGSAREYKTEAPIGKMIRVKAEADGYASSTIEVQVPEAFDPNGFSQDIKLMPSKVKINGHTVDLFTNAKIKDAKVTLEEVDDNGASLGTQVAQSDADGAFSFDGKVYSRYRIAASANEYQGFYQPIDVPLTRDALVTVTKEIRMTPADIKPITINFETAKYDLQPNQLSKFEDFIRRVKGNPNVKLEVQGYTDERGSEELNRVLSENRAKTVQEYLMSKGVPSNQLAVVKGYGKSNPLDPSSNEEAYAKNRRVEIRIVGK